MPPQARLGDKALVPADAHGCPACPHTATGPAIAGSPNVLVNGRPAIRVDDPGIHAACCGPNKWNAKTGSRSVLINGRKAHRLSDLVRHCGGMGQTIEGSPNVLVGDNSSGMNSDASRIEEHWVDVEVLDAFGEVFPGISVKITGAASHEGIIPNGSLSLKRIQKGTIIVSLDEHPLVIDGTGGGP